MAEIFDGKAFAEKKLILLGSKVDKLSEKGIKPKLVSIIIGDNPASVLYVSLKKKAAERVGAEVEVKSLSSSTSKSEVQNAIKQSNLDDKVHGIMVQLPLPSNFSKKDRDEIISSIKPEKDVDGLRKDSPFLTPTVKAVLDVLEEAMKYALPLRGNPYKVIVVGATGFEGSRILKALKEKGYQAEGAHSKTKNLKLKVKNSDIVISATGVPGLIKKDMVKEGAILIDVGSPKGDIDKEAYEKASFVSPVPGGIGPVTISCLLENLVKACYNRDNGKSGRSTSYS